MHENITEDIYLYPKESEENLYLTQSKIAWESIGYVVKNMPTTPVKLLGRLRNDIVVLNWFEDRLGHSDHQIIAFMKSVILLALVRIRYRKIIWVRHNIKPHNKYSAFLYEMLLRILDVATDFTVTHRPVKGIKSEVMPHPLYPFRTELFLDYDVRDIEYLYFGAVKKYKGLDKLLSGWPAEKPLYMAGKCSDGELGTRLRDIIKDRGLNVTWEDRFLSYDELCSLIGRSKYVLIPHADNSMIVSGAFYHAVSGGANVLITNNAFYRDYVAVFPYVGNIDSVKDSRFGQRYVSPKIVAQEASKNWGVDVVSSEWERILHDN